MTYPFEVEAEQIKNLDPMQLTLLLDMMLHDEAREYGIGEESISVSTNINASDGGVDGQIKWNGDPERTDFLYGRSTIFQAKATHNMGPQDYANEMFKKDGSLKDGIARALQSKAAYIVFTTQHLTDKAKDERLHKMTETLHKSEHEYVREANIHIYGADEIARWVNKRRSLITIQKIFAWTKRPLVSEAAPLDIWEEEYNARFDTEFDFVQDEKREIIIRNLCSLLAQPKKSARMIGPAGIGKTRLALEVCKQLGTMRQGVIYFDMGGHRGNSIDVIKGMIRYGMKGVLVIDNCDLDDHKDIEATIKGSDNGFSLLTMHYEFDRSNSRDEIEVSRMSDKDIKVMLSTAYDSNLADLDRIVSFASGFPIMAVLLADARKDITIEDAGRLSDDKLMKKLLWGSRQKVDADEKMLQACSIFERFGYDGELESELEFIANNVVLDGVTVDRLYDCISRFKDRGIVGLTGRYAQIIPMPLAIRLASDWWNSSRASRQEEIIQAKMPGELRRRFCNQIAKLDSHPKVKQLVEKLCEAPQPFGKADMILSKEGSFIFRSLVEIEPIATSNALHRIFQGISDDNILSISDNVRRNLIISLEKLCFREITFIKSAKVLLQLAANENEASGNNSTNTFKQLFRTTVSGTEAQPSSRFKVIDDGLESKDSRVRMICIEALYAIIDIHGGLRVVGAEHQGGSLRELKEWKPPTWNDAFNYWTEALDRLGRIVLKKGTEGKKAKEFIGLSVRELATTGEVMMDVLDRLIRQITSSDESFWFEASDGVKHCLLHDTGGLPSEAIAKLQEWKQLLEPKLLKEKIKQYVSSPVHLYKDDKDGTGIVNIAESEVQGFAQEASESLGELLLSLDILLTGKQELAITFGQMLIEASKDSIQLIQPSIDFIQNNPNINIQFLIGMLVGLHNTGDINKWEHYISQFTRVDTLVPYYPNIVATGKVKSHHIKTMLFLVHEKKLQPETICQSSLFNHLGSLDIAEVNRFAMELSSYSNVAKWAVLDFMLMYCYGDDERFLYSIETFRKTLCSLSFEFDPPNRVIQYESSWKRAIDKILLKDSLVNGGEFIRELTTQLMSSIGSKIEYSFIRNYVRPVMRDLLKNYPSETWSIISNTIINGDPDYQYVLIQMIGYNRHSFFNDEDPFPLSELPDDILDEWLRDNPDIGPMFIAKAINIYDPRSDPPQLSPRMVSLIDHYGDSEELLDILSTNLANFSWSGSVIPRYRNEINVLKYLLGHRIPRVRAWADEHIQNLNRMIEHEQTREAEQGW